MKLAMPLVAFLLVGALAAPALAGQTYRPYDSREAGHPLRIVAYAVHPVGVILDRLIFRPAWWIGGFEPIRTLVGREAPLPEEYLAPSAEPQTKH